MKIIVGLLVVTTALTGCAAQTSADATSPEPGSTPLTTTAVAAVHSAGDPATKLAALPVRPPASMAGYRREQFGPAWADADHNGCDTRDDILARDLSQVHRRADGCAVTSGVLQDPYTDTQVRYQRGASEVDVDHVVALANAWRSGAATWNLERRTALANDPANLLAVTASTNRAKGDADAATWQPPNIHFRCAYATRQIIVKTTYQLSVTAREKTALGQALTTCSHNAATPVSTTGAPGPHPSTPVAGTPAKTSPPTSDTPVVVYTSCAQVRAAGAAPLHRGQPGYTSRLDRDGDGTACE